MLRQAAARATTAWWATACPSALTARLSSSALASASSDSTGTDSANAVRLATPPTAPPVVSDAGPALRDARAAHRAAMTALRKQWTADATAATANADAARQARVSRASIRHVGEVAAKAAKKAKAASKAGDRGAGAGTAATAAAAAMGATWRATLAAVRAEDADTRTARLLAASQHWIGDDPAAIAARVEEALANPSPLFPGDVPPKALKAGPKRAAVEVAAPSEDGGAAP